MTKIIAILVVIIGLGIAWYFLSESWSALTDTVTDNDQARSEPRSFEECEKAGHPVEESHPRRCRMPQGQTFTEEIVVDATYENSSTDLIVVELPFPGAVVGKQFSVIGEARGNWYFEASFPVKVVGNDGEILFSGFATAEGDWMQTGFVPFKLDVSVPESYIGPATLILQKDNPSGLPENDATLSFPIVIEY